ncbi:transcriptional regulator [Streptococcus pneumoniae]|nr:transcriptional regulator [Streptococcus pneumoniae]
MELDKFKTMMNVRERMTYFLRFQRMAGSEKVGDIRPRHQQYREQTSQKILYYPLLLHEKENNERMRRNGSY